MPATQGSGIMEFANVWMKGQKEMLDEGAMTYSFGLEAVSGVLRWCEISRPYISSESKKGHSLRMVSALSYCSLIYCTRFFVHCAHIQVVGKCRFPLSRPMFAWAHPVLNTIQWISFPG